MVTPTVLRPRDRRGGRAFNLGAPANSNDPIPPRRHEAVSDVLARLSLGDPEERLTLAILRREFGPRAFGFVILVFALPNLLPVTGIPGLPVFTGAALIFFTLQLVLHLAARLRSTRAMPATLADAAQRHARTAGENRCEA